jgi:short-subunit dehydrogenase
LRNLQAVADQCLETGTEAMVIQTDVTDPDQVRSLARGAIDHFGHIDVWISNAGVGAVGAFNQTPLAAHHQVIHTNLFGAINSAYAIMPYFKKRKRGTFIVTNSVGAWIPLPNASSYSASKFGLRGFVEALQAEVSDEPDIHICEVAPAFVKTPGIFHVGNYVGKKLKNPPGAGSAERVGKSMLNLINHPHDRNAVMALTYVGRAGYFLFPKFTRWVSAKLFKAYFSQAEAAPRTDGALYSTQRAGR